MGKKDKTETENTTTASNKVVLKVDLHCDGCASKTIRILRSFPGVETVKAESDGKITVTGTVDPTGVKNKLAEKTRKKVDLISPQPKKEDNKEKEKKGKENSDNNKPKEKEELQVTSVVLKMALHCQGCIDRISKIVTRTRGVHDMSIDKEKDTITVKGTMDVKGLVENLSKRFKKKVEIVPPKKDKENKEGGDKEGGGGGKKKNKDGGGEEGGKMEVGKLEHLAPPAFGFAYPYPYVSIGGHNYVPVYPENYHLHAPQMFSDENPNACSVM